jgi:hypothetical protein
MKMFSARRESLMSFEPTFVVCFDGIAVIERGCSPQRARTLVQKLNEGLKKAKRAKHVGK